MLFAVTDRVTRDAAVEKPNGEAMVNADEEGVVGVEERADCKNCSLQRELPDNIRLR